MTTVTFSLTDLLIVWLPIIFTVLLGLLGLLRGVRREVFVANSIIVAALILEVWSEGWAADIQSVLTGFQTRDIRMVLAYLTMGLIVVVLGYILGSSIVRREPQRATSRFGGLLLGFANGAAIAGWLMRFNFETGTPEVANNLRDNPISLSFMIWAGWFPLVFAIVAAIVALVGPFRRAQTAVSTPSAASDWAPSTAPAVAGTAAGVAATSYIPPYSSNASSTAPTTVNPVPPPLGSAQQPPQPGYGAGGYQPSGYGAQSYTPPSNPYLPQGQPTRVDDSPPTMPMPASEIPRPVGGQETAYFGTLGSGASESPPASATPTAPPASVPPASTAPAPSASTSSGPITGPLSDPDGGNAPAGGSASGTTSDWLGRSDTDSSWLSGSPSTSSASSSAPTGAASSFAFSSGERPAPATDNSLLSRSEAPTQAQPVVPPPASSSSVTCSRCGTSNAADATFCTECGNRLK